MLPALNAAVPSEERGDTMREGGDAGPNRSWTMSDNVSFAHVEEVTL